MSVSIFQTMERRLGRRVSVRADGRRSAKTLRERIGELEDKAQAICDRADGAGRDLTDEEKTDFDGLVHEIKTLKADLTRAESIEDMQFRRASDRIDGRIAGGLRGSGELSDIAGRGHTEPRSTWIDSEGRPVHVLGRGQRLQDLPRPEGAPRLETPHALGHVVRAIASGEWSRCPADVRAAMAGNDNSLGGVLVPNPLSAQVIDYARARSAIWRAGAQTVPMDSDTLTIARQAEDPTIEVKGENEAFTLGALNFDAIQFVAYKVGAVIVMSRELAGDAPNAAEAVSMGLANALAAKVDQLALVGSGSVEPEGLSVISGVGSTGSVGAIAWEDLHAAVVGVKALNHEPNAYVLHPTIAGDADIITSGDGSNSAKLWLGPPPSVQPLERYETTNATTALGFVGDFTKMLVGIRQVALVEVSTEAGDFFKKHQVGIKITFRFDVNTSHPAAFHVLSGITT